MGDLEHGYTFEDGVKAGDQLLELICEINPNRKSVCSQFLTEAQLAPIFEQLRERSIYKRPLRCVEGFLSRTLRANGLESDLITFWSAGELFDKQKQVAPICEIPPQAGIIQLGDWSDGDGWCLDTAWGCIRGIYAGSGSDDFDSVRLSSYAIFYSLYQWVAYLRCDAWERGWIPAP